MRPDNAWTIGHSSVGSVYFESQGTIASEEGVSSTARRAITIELKRSARRGLIYPAEALEYPRTTNNFVGLSSKRAYLTTGLEL